MRGNLWTVLVVGVFAGLMLPALSISYDPNSAGETTLDIAAVLAPFGEIAWVLFLVVCAGAFITWFSGGDF